MEFLTKLGITHPIIQAPMAGVTTPEFVATSAKAGVLGSIGAGYLSAEQTRTFIREVKVLTNQPFAVNLFVPEEVERCEATLAQANQALDPIRRELKMEVGEVAYSRSEFEAQIEVLIEERVKVVSFTFGLPSVEMMKRLKTHELFVIGTATTVEEALLVEKIGMDAVVVQGSEAGGHRGSFHGELVLTPLIQLLSEVEQLVQIPIIAAGGISDYASMNQLLVMGASAVQIGTALLVATESGVHPVYKEALLTTTKGTTVLTTSFSGKMARGLRNRFIEEMKDAVIAPYPYQNDLTKEIRKAASAQGNPDYMSLWAGEKFYLAKEGALQEIVNRMMKNDKG